MVNPIPTTIADDSTGGVQVSSLPQPSALTLHTDNSTWTNATILTPQVEQFFNFTITDADTLATLDWVRIIVYDASKAAWDDPNNQTDHCEFFWVEDTAAWNITEEAGSSWNISTGYCRDPGIDNASTSYEFSLAFTVGSNAFEEPNTGTPWQFNVTAYDDDSLEAWNATFEPGHPFDGDCQFWSSLTIDSGALTYNFTATTAGGANVSLYLIDGASGTFLNFTVVANGVWDVLASATNWSKDAEWINIDAGDVQYINDDDWDSNGEWTEQALTQTPTVYWDGDVQGYNNTQESGAVKNIFMRLAVPGGTSGGLWIQTLTVIAQNG